MADEDDDIDLRSLNDQELTEQMWDDLYDGLADEVVEGTNILLERGWTPYDVLTKALVEGMRIVGIDFRDGILFVPEVLLAANSMKAGMTILRPLLAETGAPRLGKMVIGTVKGDIHDIGKNLVGMMMEGAGFEVIDLGINNPVENYLEALEEHKHDTSNFVSTLVEFGKKNGYEFTAEEALEVLPTADQNTEALSKQKSELSDGDLDAVAGGAGFSFSTSNISNQTFQSQLGSFGGFGNVKDVGNMSTVMCCW